uniref:ABC transporter ATP-binding protein n=1 Tax=uncultured Thiotrichaceae bacterium TaxID=298394 RepID=A0A6S6UMV9_9GAMM|nr:MAG: ABC transporter ATP-binding protein [uncultured Thiotrichaceae bacterium]
MSKSETTSPRLELRKISKYYPSVVANQDVNLTVMPGEIHAILGENGAGKSTLMKAVYGVIKPDEGEILWNGETTTINSPAQARKLGIGMVFQHFSLFDTLTVVENISLAMDGTENMGALAKRIEEVSKHYGLPLNPNRLVYDLSVGERQRVEIVRCLLQEPKLLIMDEPTSVLTPQAVRKLFETLRRLANEGCSILYISHKLDEIRELCYSATVLRMGKVTGTADPRQETAKSLAEMMIGKELPMCDHAPASQLGDELLVVNQLSREADDQFGTDLKDISLNVRAGEIFGIAGVSGNGQQELLYALSGEKLSDDANAIQINQQDAGQLNPAQRRSLGMRFIPEERLGRGAVPAMSLAMNGLLTGHDSGLSKRGFISYSKVREFSRHCIEQFNVKCGGVDAEAKSLSGGNVQKFIVGRELLLKPEVLVVSQPTWGVDVGAASFIRQTLIDLRDQGVAILVVSEELDELFEICDRIAVIHEGSLSAAKPSRETNLEEIGLLMGGMGNSAASSLTEQAA